MFVISLDDKIIFVTQNLHYPNLEAADGNPFKQSLLGSNKKEAKKALAQHHDLLIKHSFVLSVTQLSYEK